MVAAVVRQKLAEARHGSRGIRGGSRVYSISHIGLKYKTLSYMFNISFISYYILLINILKV